MNNTTLVNSIISYTENNDPTFIAEIPTFVHYAEKRIYNSVLIPVLRRNMTGQLTANNRYVQVPADFMAPYEFAVMDPVTGAYTYLLQKDVSYVREAYPNPNQVNVPKYYALFDPDTFILGPTPDKDYDVELHFYYYPESITTAGTTWLGDNYPMCLLYGALLEAYTFMKGEADVMQQYEKLFMDNVALLKNYANGRTRNDNYRSSLPKGKFQ